MLGRTQCLDSSQSESSSDEDETEDELPHSRGRTNSQRPVGKYELKRIPNTNGSSTKHNHAHTSSQSSSSRKDSPGHVPHRSSFTRSRSPAVSRTVNGGPSHVYPHRPSSPSLFSRQKNTPLSRHRTIFPGVINFTFRLPSSAAWSLTIRVRQVIENLLLLSSLGFIALKIRTCTDDPLSPDGWISIELALLIIASIIYYVCTRLPLSKVIIPALNPSTTSTTQNTNPDRPASPRIAEFRDNRRGSPLVPSNASTRKEEAGFVWMTVPKNYRLSADDGILTGLLGGPFVSAALLYLSLRSSQLSPQPSPLPSSWLIEPPTTLPNTLTPLTALEALLLSRRNLLDLSTVCSTILIIHVAASKVTEDRHRRKTNVPLGELSHVPRKESRRTYLYALFAISSTLWILCVRIFLSEFLKLGIWQNMNYFEMVVASLFYQFTLYTAIRLAHHGFTLGELGLVGFGATVLFMEMMNITRARIWPITTPYIKTYRLPTPLLIYQIALIPGSLLTGFLLSPLLYLSRHIARQPVRRLRFPEQRQKHRRLLALGFYLGAILIVGGLVGMWTRWCLHNRDPWLWALWWMGYGKKKWSRVSLVLYWGVCVLLSVAGWNRQLARSRRYRHRMNAGGSGNGNGSANEGAPGGMNGNGGYSNGTTTSNPSAPNPVSAGGAVGAVVGDALGSLTFAGLPNLPNLPNGTQMSNVATDLLDAADKHVPTLSVNARRKFFHALAVAMFLPGVALDPAFAHLSFSVAFALFTFTEYVRYFALYPFGASVHLFMNEFLDSKDSGTAILSHFYLLTGCANSVWFEGPSKLLQFTGILALGVGDALASIVGKRIGIHRWTSTSPKTVEGSVAFTVSVVACAWLLRVFGFTEDFSIIRYGVIAALASLLEAFSVQNDNLTLPLYMWSMLTVVDV
ncbi:hypothetical protein C8Q75DRAFT_724975 [Abortiporus biennis]|nr:hypothetical protein C8Q75DRAFT_724975 [Abortiporus biennis]